MRLQKSALILTALLLGGLYNCAVKAQSIPNQGYTNTNDLSDDQIKQLIKQADANGYSDAQVEDMARAKGASDDDIQKLRVRIATLRQQQSPSQGQNQNTGNNNNSTSRKSIIPSKDDAVDEEKQPFNLFDKPKQQVYGASLFHHKNLDFEPNLNLATPKNYQLGPQDELIIDLWGYSEQTYKLKISTEGFIKIPQIGPVFVNGLTIEVATALISKKLATVYSGLKEPNPNTFLQVTLGSIRSIKITLLGEVTKPGTYTLPSLATVFNALYASGGPNNNGSFRNIEVIRNSKSIVKLDIYDFLLKGDQTNNIHLEDQDIIKVNTYNIRVSITGEVKRPCLYELKETESLKNLIDFAGGYTDSAYVDRIKVFRNSEKEKTISDVASNTFASFNPQRGDQFIVEKTINRFANRVQIVGAVFRPGYFALDSTKTVLEIIKKADGLKEDAFMSRGIINRIKADNSNQVISFSVEDLLQKKSADISLQREDKVIIFSNLDLQERKTVSIEGYVAHETTFPYAEGLRLGDLILMSGGLKDAASNLRVEIARRVKNADYTAANSPFAEIITVDLGNNLKPGNKGNDFAIEPFDQVSVRKIPGYVTQEKVTVDGEAIYPGTYTISKRNDRISDIINRAGGLAIDAYAKGAYLLRKTITDSNQVSNKASLKRLQRNAKSKEDLDSLDISTAQQGKKIGIQLEKIMRKPGSAYDLLLKDGDVIKIPTIQQTVEVTGEVLLPNVVRYEKGNGVRKYISSSGGFSFYAKRRNTYVLYANGSVSSTSKFLFFKFYPKIEPGCHIFVPTKPKRQEMSAQESIAIASALASMALVIVTAVSLLHK